MNAFGTQASFLGLPADEVHLSGAVIAPDTYAGDGSIEALRFVCQLAPSPVLIEPHQRMEIAAVQARGVLHADEGVGIAGVPHNKDLTVPACHLIQCRPLQDEWPFNDTHPGIQSLDRTGLLLQYSDMSNCLLHC